MYISSFEYHTIFSKTVIQGDFSESYQHRFRCSLCVSKAKCDWQAHDECASTQSSAAASDSIEQKLAEFTGAILREHMLGRLAESNGSTTQSK
jgi:hypothetical protein